MLLAAMVVFGNTVFAGLGKAPIAMVSSFAAGAVLASLAEALMPQAYQEGGKAVSFATTVGFLLTFLITQG